MLTFCMSSSCTPQFQAALEEKEKSQQEAFVNIITLMSHRLHSCISNRSRVCSCTLESRRFEFTFPIVDVDKPDENKPLSRFSAPSVTSQVFA